jgi:hypothetical protein
MRAKSRTPRKVSQSVMRDSTDFELLRSSLELQANGRLALGGQPMILLPQHFFRNILREVHAAAGPERFQEIFCKAGYDGAITFCRRFMENHGCRPREAVEGYLAEMSLRGWGQFAVLRLEPEVGLMEVLLRDSAVAGEGDLPSGNVIWRGAIRGAMAFLQESMGLPLKEFSITTREEVSSDHGGARGFRMAVNCRP